MRVIALLFWLKTKSNQPMAAPSMNRPTTFVTFDIYIYIITGHRVCVCVCAMCMYSVHSLLLWLYTVQWRWVGCCCRCACQWRDRSCCTVPVCTTTLFQILCQNVQCAVCAVPSPLAHKWRPVDHHGSDQWSCTGVFQITDEVMTTIGDISETPTVTR